MPERCEFSIRCFNLVFPSLVWQDALQKQLNEYRTVIDRQQQALLEVSAPLPTNNSFLNESHLHDETAALRRQQRQFEAKLRNFEASGKTLCVA